MMAQAALAGDVIASIGPSPLGHGWSWSALPARSAWPPLQLGRRRWATDGSQKQKTEELATLELQLGRRRWATDGEAV